MPGDGVHGRLHPDPRLRARRHARRRPRSTPSCRRTSRARCSIRPIRSRIGAMVGPEAFMEVRYLAHHKQICARSSCIPQLAAEFEQRFGRDSGGLVRSYRCEDAETIVVALGSVIGTLQGSGRRDARRAASRIGVARHPVVPAVPARRRARGAAGREARRRAGEVLLRSASAASSRPTCASRCRASQLHGYTVIAGPRRTRDHQGIAERMLREADRRRARAADLPRPRLATSSTASSSARRRRGAAARPPRTCCATSAPVAAKHRLRSVMEQQPSSSIRPARSPSATACSRPSSARCRRSCERTNSLNSGHRACQGCGEALGARYAIDAAMRATGNQLIAVNATGCLEVFSTPYPETSWQMPVDPFAVRQCRGGGHRHRRARNAALKAATGSVRVIAQGGDGGTTDIGFGCLSGMFERNDDVLYICYDNEAYMNTGVQRSSARRRRRRARRRRWRWASTRATSSAQGKNVPLIAMAHEIPYVATATRRRPARPRGQGRARDGHRTARATCTSSCRARSAGARRSHDTIRLARLARETGIFPVFEAEHGEVTRVHQDPAPRAGRGVPAAAEALRASVRRQGPRRSMLARIQADRRPQHPPLRAAGRGGTA